MLVIENEQNTDVEETSKQSSHCRIRYIHRRCPNTVNLVLQHKVTVIQLLTCLA